MLVNNAVHTGAGSMDHFLDLTVELLETKLEANVVAQFVLAKLVIPSMLERGDGTIINITSAVAISDPPAPAGQGRMGHGLRDVEGRFPSHGGHPRGRAWPDRGIRAFNVEPGYVLTERMAVNQAELGFEGVYRGAPPSVPASVVTWLASSPEAEALNGTTVERAAVRARARAPRRLARLKRIGHRSIEAVSPSSFRELGTHGAGDHLLGAARRQAGQPPDQPRPPRRDDRTVAADAAHGCRRDSVGGDGAARRRG